MNPNMNNGMNPGMNLGMNPITNPGNYTDKNFTPPNGFNNPTRSPGNGVPFSSYPNSFDQQMPIVEPTYSQHIIKPPERNTTYGRIPKRVFIDSSDRDIPNYPDPAKYVYELEHELDDVVSIELVQACIPNSGYVITEGNNKICFQESLGVNLLAVIPPGNYTIVTLAVAIQKAMSEAPGAESTYKVTCIKAQNKISISSNLAGGDNIFILLFRECPCDKMCDALSNTSCPDCNKPERCSYPRGSIAKTIGYDFTNRGCARGTVTGEIADDTIIGNGACFTNEFAAGDCFKFEQDNDFIYKVVKVVSPTEMLISPGLQKVLNKSKIFLGKHTADFTYDLSGDKYIILNINESFSEGSWGKTISNNKNTHGAFVIIPFMADPGENNFYDTGSSPRKGEIKYFNPPLGKLSKIQICFLRPNGEKYNFNGREHFVDLEIITLNSPGKYTNGFVE